MKEKKEKNKKLAELAESPRIGIAASITGLSLVLLLCGFTAYNAFCSPMLDTVFGREKEAVSMQLVLNEESGKALYDVLSVYAEENPDASVITAGEDGNITETDPSLLAGIVTDDYGRQIGVLVEGNGVEDAEGNRIGAVTPDGKFVEGAAGVTVSGEPYYHVVWGDTLCKVSSAVHYSVQELAEYNHISNVNLIYAESDLRIPFSGSSVSGNDVCETDS